MAAGSVNESVSKDLMIFFLSLIFETQSSENLRGRIKLCISLLYEPGTFPRKHEATVTCNGPLNHFSAVNVPACVDYNRRAEMIDGKKTNCASDAFRERVVLRVCWRTHRLSSSHRQQS